MQPESQLYRQLRHVSGALRTLAPDRSAAIAQVKDQLDEAVRLMPPEMNELTNLLRMAGETLQALTENPVNDPARLVEAVMQAVEVAAQFMLASPPGGQELLAAEASAALRQALQSLK